MGIENTEGGETEEKPLTAKEITDLVSATMNAAIVDHEKRNSKKRGEELSKLIADAVKAVIPAPEKKPEGTGGTSGDPSKETPEMAAMRSKLEQFEKDSKTLKEQVSAERTAREAAETKARNDKTFNDFRTLLAPHVRPDMLDDIAELQFKRVKHDEEGKPLFVARRPPGPGLAEVDVDMPMGDGVAHWVKTKDAQKWLPAPNSGGAGGTGNQRKGAPTAQMFTGPATTDAQKAQRALEAEQALIAKGFSTG